MADLDGETVRYSAVNTCIQFVGMLDGKALPLARPAILAVLLLSFIRALEAFEVPLLIGIPGGVVTVTTALFQSIHSGFLPRYGEASAYAVLLTAAVSVPLFLYYRATRAGAKFATAMTTWRRS